MDVRPSLPPAVGRADLVRAGLDQYGAKRDLATWFGFDYRASTASGALVDDASEARSSRAGGPAEVTEVDQSVGPAILCRQSITFSREDAGEDRTPTADTTTWLNRPKQPPRFLPLGTSQRTRRLLEPLLDLTSERGSADIKRVVNTLARARPLSRIPRRERTNFAETLQCVVDRSTRLTPFWLDQTFVVEQVRRLFPQVSLLIWVYEEAAHAFNALTAATPDAPDPALGPLLVLGDLGTYATLEARAMWRRLARFFVFEGGRAGAMLPCSSEEVSLTEVGPWELLPWEGDARLPPRASDLERLVSFASAAIRLDPGLLRAIRKEILPETSASLEIKLWMHAAISSRSVEAASFDPKLRAVYHGRLSELSKREPKAVRTCLRLISEWRHLTSDEIWYEEILGLPKVIRDDASFVDPMDIATANTFFAALRQGASQGSLEPGHEAWLARAGRRQQRDGLWQNPNAAAAMKSVLESDPNFVPPVIVDTEVDREDWHAHIALDGEGGLWLSSAPLAGQSLGTIAMRGGDFEVLSPDRNGRQVAAGRVTTDGKQLRLETPQPPFVILSARGAVEVDQVRPQDLGWASAVSSDSVGPWADLRLGDALLRFRWVPPGRGIVGPAPADEAAEELAQGKPGTTVPVRGRPTEVVFSRGFWLMERPISRGDMSAILGERSEPSAAALPAVEVSIEDVTAVFERVRTVNWDTRLRLPSPTEWEYACRARVLDQTTYFGTPNLSDAYDKTLSQIAWFSPSDDMLGRRDLRRLEGPMRSMQKKANPWGLFDMLGNVAEWCLDASSQADEQPVKGGSFRHGPESLRAAYVEHVAQQSRLDWVGFRPALGESEIESLRQITPPRSKYIERNRAPRVQIAYDVEHYGSPTSIELPFVMGVMADLAGVSETAEASKPVTERAFREVDADRFPKFMESLAPRVKARVNCTLPRAEGEERGEELAIDLSFKSMDDFAPDKVAEQIPQLAELLKMRRQLEELLGFMDGRIDAEKRIAQLLNNEPLLGQIAAQAVDDKES